MKIIMSFLIVLCATTVTVAAAFQASPLLTATRNDLSTSQSQSTITTSTLYSTPPSSQRQPRRNLPKRRRKGREGNNSRQASWGASEFPWETAESRCVITSISKEIGEDYWIDQKDLKHDQERREAINRREPGQITNEKLWIEILSPYKQNWIGIISVIMVVLTTIVTKFPELVEAPTIVIPDL
jgi:hypothetical protein